MKHKLLLIFILILAGALRIIYGLYSAPEITSSGGTFGLMAKHIAECRAFPVWEYGTTSVGSFFSYMAAPFLSAFGGSRVCLAIVELVFSVLFVLSTYFAGRMFFDKTGAMISALLVCFAPSVLTKSATFPAGVYNILLFIGSTLVFLTLKICSDKKLYLFIIFGFLSGLAFWIHLSSLCFIIPCVLFILFNLYISAGERVKRSILISALLFFIGSSPFWLFNLGHQFATFKSVILRSPEDIQYSFKDVIFLQLHNILDIKSAFSIAALLGLFYFTGFIYLCYRLRGKLFNSKYALILLLVIISVVLTYKVEFKPALYFHPSILLYIVFPYVLTFWLLEIKKARSAVFTVSEFQKGGLLRGTKSPLTWIKCARRAHFIIALPLIVSLQLLDSSLKVFQENILKNRAIYSLIEQLREDDIRSLYSSYELVPIINYLTQEDITAAYYDKSPYPYYTAGVDASPKSAVVLPLDEGADFIKHLKYISMSYIRTIIDQYVLFHSLEPPHKERIEVFPENWSGTSNYNAQEVGLAFDRDIATRWTTHAYQVPDMYFQADLGEGIIIDKVVLYLGEYICDRALGLKIEVSVDKENWEKVVCLEGNRDILFWSGPHMFWKNYADRQEYYFNPVKARYVRFTQTGYRFKWDKYWSVVELFIYSPIGEGEVLNYDLAGISPYIKEKGFNNIYADYWLSANLKSDTSYVSGKIDLSCEPIVIVDKNGNIEGDFGKYGASYSKEGIGDFYIFHSLRSKNAKLRAISKEGWQGSSNCSAYGIENAIDNDLTTRWRSDKYQSPGFYFRVDLEEEQELSGATLWHEGSPTDWPRGIRIEVLEEGSGWQAVESHRDYSDSLYWSGFGVLADSSRNFTYSFEPVKVRSIRFVLTGSSSGYCWSIHEVDLLEKIVD